MNTIDIAKAVLKNQRNDDGTLKYPNVQIKEDNRERCDYDGPDNTTCYVQNKNFNKNQKLINRIMAAHEVCHFLNYEEGVSNFRAVRKTNSWPAFWGATIIIAISAIVAYFNIDFIAEKISILFGLYSVLTCYFSYKSWVLIEEKLRIYSDDEQHAQDRAVRELLAINNEYALNLNEEEMAKEAQKFLNRYVYGINNFVRVVTLLALITTFVLNFIIWFRL